jgi:putative oxidoreductase
MSTRFFKTASQRGSDAAPVAASWLTRSWPLLLRLTIGYGFFMHGYAKWSRGPETFAVVLHTLGVPLPALFAWLTTFVELAGGLAVLAGAFIPLVSLPMLVVLLTALFTVHWPYGFFSVKLVEVSASGIKFGTVGYEIILLYLAGLVALAAGGAGPYSVDEWRAGRRGVRPGVTGRVRSVLGGPGDAAPAASGACGRPRQSGYR